MVVFKRKNRMISFRVSEDEYHQLQAASHSSGARSVSDFARDNLFCLLRSDHSNGIEGRVDRISEALATLDGEIQRLRSRLPDPV